jgi:hypothetical protein
MECRGQGGWRSMTLMMSEVDEELNDDGKMEIDGEDDSELGGEVEGGCGQR